MSMSLTPTRSCVRVVRRNACAFFLILLLAPWAFLLYQLHTHFGGLYSTPLKLLLSQAFRFPEILPPEDPTPVLLVTAYFPLSTSRYPIKQHGKWMRNLLSRVTTDLYVFTTPDFAPTVAELRGNLPVHINASFTSLYDVPVINDLVSEFPWHFAKERDGHRPSTELHLLRTAKPWFMHQALHNVMEHDHQSDNQTDRSRYRYVFWNDIGGMREKGIFSDWPSVDRLDSVWAAGEATTGMQQENLLFVPIDRQPLEHFRRWKPEHGPIEGHREFSEGTFFGGRLPAVQWLSPEFYRALRQFLSKGHSISSERAIMNSLMFLHPERFITVFNRDPEEAPRRVHERHGSYGYCGNPWFYYIFWLSHDGERDEQNILWSDARWRWDWWRERKYCRVAQTLSVKDVLRRTYGSQWKPAFLANSTTT